MASALIKDLLAKQIVTKAAYPCNLYQLLGTMRRDGVGARVTPETWLAYPNAKNNFFTITAVNLTPGYAQGIVSGQKTWQGMRNFYFQKESPV